MNLPCARQSVQSEIELLSNMLKKDGYRVDQFHKKGNGIKSLLQSTGRLTDFKGLFIFFKPDNFKVFVGESENVLREIQKIARCQRKKDQDYLMNIAESNGLNTIEDGQSYLLTMNVHWIEIIQRNKRLTLCRAIQSTNFSIL